MIRKLTAAFWFGSALFLMLAASAVFRVAPDPTTAADIVGSLLTRWHYIALAAPLVLFVTELRKGRPIVVAMVFAALILATAQGFIDLRIRNIRWMAPEAISSMRADNPVKREFRALHGVSMSLLLLQALIAGFVVIARPYEEQEPGSEDSEDNPAQMPVPATREEAEAAARAVAAPPGAEASQEATANPREREE